LLLTGFAAMWKKSNTECTLLALIKYENIDKKCKHISFCLEVMEKLFSMKSYNKKV